MNKFNMLNCKRCLCPKCRFEKRHKHCEECGTAINGIDLKIYTPVRFCRKYIRKLMVKSNEKI